MTNKITNILSYTILLSFILFMIYSCEKTKEEYDEDKFGYDYFPLEIGKYWIYKVDSTIYDDQGSKIINTISEVKEEVVERYTDQVGDTIYRIERSWRTGDSTSWKLTDVWTSYENNHQAFRTEENLKFIKFVFPPIKGLSWNGNLYIDESTVIDVAGESVNMYSGWDNYKIGSLDITETIGKTDYAKVATVLQTDDNNSNAIERRYAIEKYARGVGLVYKEYEILDSQCITCSQDWQEKAEKGFILKQTLIGHN